MSEYNPDEILADPNAHPVHQMYAAINKDIRDNGARWSKCANCGCPYKVTENLGDTVCSERCEREFAASLNEGF